MPKKLDDKTRIERVRARELPLSIQTSSPSPYDPQVKPTNRKYNWELLKHEFLTGEYAQVSVFLRSKFGEHYPKSDYSVKQYSGWAKERKKFIEDNLAKMREKIEERRVKKAVAQLDKLIDVKDDLINLMAAYLSEGNAYEIVETEDKITGEKKKRVKLLISSAEFKNMWQMIKAEIGEPTSFTQQDITTKGLQVHTNADGGVFGLKQLMLEWSKEYGTKKTETNAG